MTNHIIKQWVVMLLCTTISMASLPACSKNSEQDAYEEVLSTLSIQKLASFLETYPDGKYEYLVINEFLDRCDAEPDPKSCNEMLLEAIPGNSKLYDIIAERYDGVKYRAGESVENHF